MMNDTVETPIARGAKWAAVGASSLSMEGGAAPARLSGVSQ